MAPFRNGGPSEWRTPTVIIYHEIDEVQENLLVSNLPDSSPVYYSRWVELQNASTTL